MNERIIKEAAKQATKSLYRFRIGAVVYSGSKILGVGYNQPHKTHPDSTVPYNTIHAELAAILKARNSFGPKVLHNASIYVHRLWRTGQVGYSKPCQYCEAYIKKVGIKDINYSYGPKRIL